MLTLPQASRQPPAQHKTVIRKAVRIAHLAPRHVPTVRQQPILQVVPTQAHHAQQVVPKASLAAQVVPKALLAAQVARIHKVAVAAARKH